MWRGHRKNYIYLLINFGQYIYLIDTLVFNGFFSEDNHIHYTVKYKNKMKLSLASKLIMRIIIRTNIIININNHNFYGFIFVPPSIALSKGGIFNYIDQLKSITVIILTWFFFVFSVGSAFSVTWRKAKCVSKRFCAFHVSESLKFVDI